MNGSGLTVSRVLRILGAALIDTVVIIIFVKKFYWFDTTYAHGMDAGESLLMMLILLFGLIAVDWAIIGPPLYKKVGIAFSIALATLLVLYGVIANIVSILTRVPLLMVPSKLIWYIVWQLLILGIFVLFISLIAAFARRNAQSIAAGNAERAFKGNVALMLSDMQAALAAREDDPAAAPVMEAFRALKERINASTPFGRIQGNPAVADLEYRIMGNLNHLLSELRTSFSDGDISKIYGLMEETRTMVMNRERLNLQ